jgi:hypothetical protein
MNGRYVPPTPTAMLIVLLSDVFEREGERPPATAVAVAAALDEVVLAFSLPCWVAEVLAGVVIIDVRKVDLNVSDVWV